MQAVLLLDSAQEKAKPLLDHAQEALGGLYESLAAYSVQGIHAASEHLVLAQQALSARIHGFMHTVNGN